ncbi:MAG: FeoB-associated Cys-rich membrane protein [Ruminococcus sp.]|nr:FeoB-associated Cys-rich membrane protein [Ruminococcus sp.]
MGDNLANIIVIVIVAAIIILAGLYIYKSKKSGKKCIGCPDSATCGKVQNNSSSCSQGCACCAMRESCSTHSETR